MLECHGKQRQSGLPRTSFGYLLQQEHVVACIVSILAHRQVLKCLAELVNKQ
jgi:hypothetical protein